MSRTVVRTANIPETFAGTYEQATVNLASHRWESPRRDEAQVCSVCDAKFWHVAASYPCGASVPRVVRTFYSDGSQRDLLVGHEEVEL